MEYPNRLEIVQTRELDVRSYYQWLLIRIIVVLLPILLLCVHIVHFHGEDTYRLKHDIETAMPLPVPVPSMWVDYQRMKNGSAYVPVGLIMEGMYEMFILHFPWSHQMTALLQLSSESSCSFIILDMLILKMSTKLHKTWRIAVFLVLVIFYSCLLCLAIDGILTTAYVSARENFLSWLESNIVELFLDSDLKEEITYHPFTLGLYPPYFLTRRFRYRREDIVFECEYNVTTDLDVDPRSITTWWRKNGAPVELNDRMSINVRIEPIDNDIPFTVDGLKLYLVRSTLTIEVIEQSDYGLYTCDYINPLPGRVRVKNYGPQNNPNYKPVRTPQPMTPQPKCACQPTFREEAQNRSLAARTVCFSEFSLMPLPVERKTIPIRPGGILVTVASYRTVANMSDIKVDVTFEGNTDRKGNSECCSLFIKFYWALFRTGSFVDLPISRLLGQHFQDFTNYLAIIKYSCICVDSFGIRDYSFYRDHFNMTTRKLEEIEIKHPVSLIIQPRDNGSKPLVDSFSFCSRSDGWLCWCVEVLLENSLYIFYTYDVFILTGLIIIVLSLGRVKVLSAELIAKPLRKLCFSNPQYIFPFTAVLGPPVYVTNSSEDEMSANYDIYLSYSEDDIYDTEVARHLKALLTEAQLTVFDSVDDILPGHLVAHESAEAIRSSRRFVFVASKTYARDNHKKMEFVAIQDTIVSRVSVPKDCILIVQVEDCDIGGLHRVPCIHVPRGLKETFLLDQSSINRFSDWITATRPVNQNENTIASQFHSSGFTIKSAVFIVVLVHLSSKSSIFGNITQWPEGTDIVNVA